MDGIKRRQGVGMDNGHIVVEDKIVHLRAHGAQGICHRRTSFRTSQPQNLKSLKALIAFEALNSLNKPVGRKIAFRYQVGSDAIPPQFRIRPGATGEEQRQFSPIGGARLEKYPYGRRTGKDNCSIARRLDLGQGTRTQLDHRPGYRTSPPVFNRQTSLRLDGSGTGQQHAPTGKRT